MPLQKTVADVLQYSFLWTFAAKFCFVRSSVVALVSFTTEAKLFQTLEFLFEKTTLSLVRFLLCLSQHLQEKIIDSTSAVKLSFQSFDRNCLRTAFIFGRIRSSSSFSARSRDRELVYTSNSSKLFTPQNFVKKLWYSSSFENYKW